LGAKKRILKKKTEKIFQTKDSGKRLEFESGMVRDIASDKPDYTLIWHPFLLRIVELLGRGLVKYGRDNWMKASGQEELDRFKQSALRHMYQYLEGDTSEDHMAAVCFNLMGAEYVLSKLNDKK